MLKQHARQHMNVILRDQLAVLRLRGGGIALVVFLDQLDLAPGDLVVHLLEGHLQPFQHVLARRGEDAGEWPEIADADRVGANSVTREQEQNQDDDGDGTDHGGSEYIEGGHGSAAAPRTLPGRPRGRSPFA